MNPVGRAKGISIAFWFLVLLSTSGIGAATVFGQDTWLSSGKPDNPPAVWNGQNTLPAGLHAVQLKGNLVCPPLRVLGYGVLLACDDRTVKLVSEDGVVRWSLEMDRLIRGPLYSLTGTMALVALSGDQVAAFRMDGGRVWQQRIEGSGQSWYMGLADGRLVQIFMDGRIRFCNPDGSSLFLLNARREILPVPKLAGNAIELRLAGGSGLRLLPSGELENWKTSTSTPVSPVPGGNAVSVGGGLVFGTISAAPGTYAIHVSSSEAVLDFSSRGEIGHWIVDNRPPGMVVWGDSLWRCFLFRPEHAELGAGQASSVPTRTMENREAGDGRPYGFAGLFQDLKGSPELEWRYLQSLMRDDPVSGTRMVLDHVTKAVADGRLAGRLQFYEDVLAWLLETAVTQPIPDTAAVVDALRLMGRFPSLRHLPRIVRLFETSRDEMVSVACLEFWTRLASDPDGLALEAVDRALGKWIADGRLSRMVRPGRLFVQACQISWPAIPAAVRLRASLGGKP